MKILLVEDNSSDACVLVELLKEQEGVLEIFCVTDGYEALDYVYQREKYEDAWRPDLILLDLGLPRITGYPVLYELKIQPQFVTIPVVILTASRNPLDREQCIKLGADCFLTKPQDLKEYDELVRQLVTMSFPRLR